jgi:hypothetical protein
MQQLDRARERIADRRPLARDVVVLERLQHEGIAKVLGEIDAALVAMFEDDERLDDTQAAVDHLSDALIAHLKYEEDQLLEPIGRLAIRI